MKNFKVQSAWNGEKNLYNKEVLKSIETISVLHKDIEKGHSSAAACINVLGNQSKEDLKVFLNTFKLGVHDIIEFPNGGNIGGKIYNDKGYVIFEWIGPKVSPINEDSEERGKFRTSIDAFILAKINNKVTQILIEWKFTEEYKNKKQRNIFGGKSGNERLYRYSSILASMRNAGFPFKMQEEDTIGLASFAYEPLYMLLRMTLLARKTTPLKFENNNICIEDYRILHLTHSQNQELNILSEDHLTFCPGLKGYVNKSLHETWREVLSENEALKFFYGYWDTGINSITDINLKNYLKERYYP